MTDLASKPARSAQNRELTFEQLLDSDDAAALLKIHPKTPAENGPQRRDHGSASRKTLKMILLPSKQAGEKQASSE